MLPEWWTEAVVLQQLEFLHAQPTPRLETRMRRANLRSFMGVGEVTVMRIFLIRVKSGLALEGYPISAFQRMRRIAFMCHKCDNLVKFLCFGGVL
jgi:hypothetical protein